MFIAGDVGGTKVRLAYYLEKKGLQCLHEQRYASNDFSDFSSLLKKFLEEIGHPMISNATFGIAGPIQGRVCKATNLPWIIEADRLEKELHIGRVFLINDLEANAWGLRCLKESEFFVLNPGEAIQGNQALISAGTGLGEAGLYWNGTEHLPFACEGGHCDFAPTNEEEIDLLRYLHKKFSHVSFERILSGSGLNQIYRFLVDTKREKEDLDIQAIATEKEPQKMITEKGMKTEEGSCFRACELFTKIYAKEAANLALKFLSRGGLFIGGGIAPKFTTLFDKDQLFMKAFVDKGRFASLLGKMSVKVVLNDKTALLGAAQYGKQKELLNS